MTTKTTTSRLGFQVLIWNIIIEGMTCLDRGLVHLQKVKYQLKTREWLPNLYLWVCCSLSGLILGLLLGSIHF